MMVSTPKNNLELDLENLIEIEWHQKRENKLAYFRPEKWQREFIEKTDIYQETWASKANRIGGTLMSGAMASVWSTGRYNSITEDYSGNPYTWKGRKYDYPTRGLIICPDNDQARGAMQRLLFGNAKRLFGQGPENDPYPVMPRDALIFDEIKMSTDVPGLIDYAGIRHETGDLSYIYMKSQKQDPMTVAGDEFDWAIFDEFPEDERWYGQVVTRIQTRDGLIFVSATPEQKNANQLQCINRFIKEKPKMPDGTPLTSYRFVHLNEAEHLTPFQKERMIASYSKRERIYRVEGKPFIGTGFIYDVPDENIMIMRDKLPNYRSCRHIIGLDWGMSDWGALVWIMIHNAEYYVWHVKKIKCHPREAAQYIKDVNRHCLGGMNVPLAWGHDAGNSIAGQGTSETSVINMFRDEGINVLHKRAHNAFCNDDSNAKWPGIHYIQELLGAGYENRPSMIKAVKSPEMEPFWSEKAMYYQDENGQIPKKKDSRFDVMDAWRYGIICDPFAEEWNQGYQNVNVVRMTMKDWNPLWN